MGFPGIEPTTPHLSYLLISLFLILFALFSELIRNRIHLSEPPLATACGILFGPNGITAINPRIWDRHDVVTQEFTRIVAGVQVFAVGISLPKGYMKRRWRSVAMFLGPIMTFGWIVTAVIVHYLLHLSIPTALIVAACLAPTDPVLSASVLGEAKFAQRVPLRLRDLLSAEAGCNDGVSFPFLYIGILAILHATAGQAVKEWFLNIILWQCLVGTILGVLIGKAGSILLRINESRGYITSPALFVFYFLLSIFCVGVGSTLGVDDFLVAFAAGTAFAWDGFFAEKTKNMKLPQILDLMLNSTLFVYYGAIIPWHQFTGDLAIWRLLVCVLLIILFRRIPIVVLLKRWIPDVKTYSEALFCGHFGPMGCGALFLAIEARARLETGTSVPLPAPPKHPDHEEAVLKVWPVICFVVLGSIMVHGFSAGVISVAGHFSRNNKERSSLVGNETDGLLGMVHDEDPPTHEHSDDDSDRE